MNEVRAGGPSNNKAISDFGSTEKKTHAVT